MSKVTFILSYAWIENNTNFYDWCIKNGVSTLEIYANGIIGDYSYEYCKFASSHVRLTLCEDYATIFMLMFNPEICECEK